MLPYWLLFGLFAIGAFRYMHVARAAPSAPVPENAGGSPARPGDRALALAAFIPALMIGLRYEVGTDFGAYSDMFDDITRRGLDYGFSRIDPGYALVNWMAGEAGFELWLANLACGALFMFGLVRFAKIQPQPWLALTVAVPYLIIAVGMGYSRQAVAIGFCMAGLASIATRGSLPRFIAWVLVGALFHRSAVILIPIVAIAYSRNRFQAVVIGLVGCALGYYVLGQGQGLEHFQRGYITQARESQGAGIRLAMNLPPALIFLAFARRFTADPVQIRIWLVFSLISVVSFGLWTTLTTTTAIDRMALYIIPLQLYVLAGIPTALSSAGKSSGLLVAIVVAYSALVEFVWLNFSNNARYWLPYQLYPFS